MESMHRFHDRAISIIETSRITDGWSKKLSRTTENPSAPSFLLALLSSGQALDCEILIFYHVLFTLNLKMPMRLKVMSSFLELPDSL